MDKRLAVVKDLQEGILLYTEIAKAWLVKAIKQPLISLINDPTLNLNFLFNLENQTISQPELQSRLMKSKVRLKGVLKGILEHSTEDNIPMPLMSFLASLVKPGQYVPDGFLSNFEIENL